MRIELDLRTPFNLEYTLQSGQVFRWEKIGGWWYGIVRGEILKIRQSGNYLYFEGADEAFLRNYFRLNDDLPSILSTINRDKLIEKAIQKFYGLRIIRQEPWECLISYICATCKNIPAIKKMVNNISKNFGHKRVFDGYEFYTFPEPSDLAQATMEELKKCKLGFRAEYISKVSRMVLSRDFNLETLSKFTYKKAKQGLITLPGVGHKVADCVLLFSLDKLEAFPIDVWMKRLILSYYRENFDRDFLRRISSTSGLSERDYSKIIDFGQKYFGRYAGYAQEYLFFFGRCFLY
jgi:N-glycosylase/DNA lyase